jgi:hypothetical protein
MLVLVCCAGLLSTAWFLAALSIWVSTIARRPREALFVAFGLEALWLIVPPVVRYKVVTGWDPVDDALRYAADWVGASSPVYAVVDLFRSLQMGGGRDWEESFLWMIALQAGFGVVLAILAAVQLRPIFRRQDGAVARPRGLRSMLAGRRLRSHPPLGDRPMVWKELHTGGARGFARIVGGLLTLVLGGLLLYYGVWYGLSAFLEMCDRGYAARLGWWFERARSEFFTFLKVVIPLLYVVWIVLIGGAAAASVSSEHEDDTWVSLTATDLTGREIVLAKLFGSLWRARRIASMILLLLVAGIGVDSLHYLSLPSVVLALAVFGGFAAALGGWISIQLRSTWRAQFLTIALLLLINVIGQGVLNILAPYGIAPQDWPGFTPYEVAKFVMEPGFFEGFKFAEWPRFWQIRDVDDGPGWLAIFSLMSLVGYASLGSLLTWDTLRRFEIVAGRARRRRVGSPSTAGVPQLTSVGDAQPT